MAFIDHDTAPLDDFGHTLEQLSELISSLTRLEEAKAEAASTGQHHRINDLLQQEQAQILKLRGMEQRHTRQLKELGWQGLTFRQILETAGEKEQNFLSPLFDRLNGQLRLLSNTKDSADRILRMRLKEFEEALAGVPQPHLHDTYV